MHATFPFLRLSRDPADRVECKAIIFDLVKHEGTIIQPLIEDRLGAHVGGLTREMVREGALAKVSQPIPHDCYIAAYAIVWPEDGTWANPYRG